MNAENTHTTLKATTRGAAPEMGIRREPLAAGARETLAELAAEINRVIDPPESLSADDIFVRSLLLVSDEPNLYGGRFGEQELLRIADLVIDSPVLVGHRKDTLPIARVFRAEVITHEGALWVRAHFYWLKKSSGADTLATNIDGGLYKECSLGFTFMRAECSVCGSDIRRCAHNPEVDSDNNSAAYYYRDIQRVLEISLVYRGATLNTKVGATLGFTELDVEAEQPGAGKFDFVPSISIERVCLLTGACELSPEQLLTDYNARKHPGFSTVIASADLQDDLPVLIGRSGGELFALRDDGLPAPDCLASALLRLAEYPEQEFLLYGRLVGMRGKQRRSLSELARRLNSGAGPVRSFKLRAIALLFWDKSWFSPESAEEFQNKLACICKNSDRLSLARRQNSRTAKQDSGCEQVHMLGEGEFRLLRAPGTPGALCRRVEIDAKIESLLASDDKDSTCDQSYDCSEPAAVTSVKFDKVAKYDGRLRLVNARVGAHLGDLCGAEECVFIKPLVAYETVISESTTIHLRGLAGQPLVASSLSDGDLFPGVCHALKSEERASSALRMTVNMSIGSRAQAIGSRGETSSVRMIELQCGDKRIAALLAEERTSDVPARK